MSGSRADLVRTDDNWKNWKFYQFLESLRKSTERNPIPAHFEHQRERLKGGKITVNYWKGEEKTYIYLE